MWRLIKALNLTGLLAALFGVEPALAQMDGGSWDSTWAGGGTITFDGDNKNANATSTYAPKILVATNGALVLAGAADNNIEAGGYWWLGGLSPAGQFLTDFGASDGSGRITECQLGFVCLTTADQYLDSLLQPDGKVLVLSADMLSRTNSGASSFDTAGVAGGSGHVGTQFTINDAGGTVTASASLGAALALGPSGTILVAGAGKYRTSGTASFGIVRLLPDLSLDASFNAGPPDGNGVTFGGGQYIDIANSLGAQAIALQSDGRIILAGLSQTLFTGAATPGGDKYAYADILLARLQSDGSLDTSFANNGTLTWGTQSGDYGLIAPPYSLQILQRLSLTIDRADRIYLTYFAQPLVADVAGPGGMLVYRFNPDGSFDDGFGSSGMSFNNSFPACTVLAQAFALAIDSAGRLLAAGGCDDQVGVERLRGDTGSLDTSFGFGGFAHGFFSDTSPVDAATGIVIDSSGRPVLSGYSYPGDSVYSMVGAARITYDLIYTNNFEKTPRGCLPPDCD